MRILIDGFIVYLKLILYSHIVFKIVINENGFTFLFVMLDLWVEVKDII